MYMRKAELLADRTTMSIQLPCNTKQKLSTRIYHQSRGFDLKLSQTYLWSIRYIPSRIA